MILDLIKHDIAVYVSHTNIDVVEDGLNDWFCQLLDIEETVILIRRGQITVLVAWEGAPQTFGEFAAKVKAFWTR